jgi:hypothetical protein
MIKNKLTLQNRLAISWVRKGQVGNGIPSSAPAKKYYVGNLTG